MKSTIKSFSGLCNSSAQAWQLSRIIDFSTTNIIVTNSNQEAQNLYQDLGFFSDSQKLTLFNNWEILPFETNSPRRETSAERIKELLQIRQEERTIVTTIRALLQKIPQPINYLKNSLNLVLKEHYQEAELIQKLTRIGYQQNNSVQHVGEFNFKGKVLDIFTNPEALPLRLEFEDSNLIKISFFDSQTELKTGLEKQSLSILPVREVDYSISPEDILRAIKTVELPIKYKLEIERQVAGQQINFPGIENFTSLLGENLQTFLDLTQSIHPEIQLYLIDPENLETSYQKFYGQLIKRHDKLSLKQAIASPKMCYEDLEYFKIRTKNAAQIFSDTNQAEADPIKQIIPTQGNQEIIALQNLTYAHNQHPINPLLSDLTKQGYQIKILAQSEIRQTRIKSLLEAKLSKQIEVIAGNITNGFKLLSSKIIYISESDLFPVVSRRQKQDLHKTSLKSILNTLSTLTIGDFIIHEDYGRGIYQGLKKMQIAEASGDFLQLKYADSTLYLPVQKIGRLQKYVSNSEQVPELDKLGSNKWPTLKSKVRKSIQELAGELLKLYALRENTPGMECPPWGSLDQEFADYFPYNETPDQLQAIQETIADLSSGQVMERLICGDVGFGKTEIALRAAFKVASEGLQVAVLAPTTLLVDQHLNNFRERFKSFPIRVEALSRFYSTKQNQQTLAELTAGKVDLIIGTHALLKNRNIFKRLGLLIIDEEQRFGVKQKERIKQMQSNVHVLSMSATPIPRTLYMSLIGVRKISTISSPPAERLAVKTYLMNYSEEVIEDAIWKEIQRGGQVYFLHNQIKDLDLTLATLKKLVPTARFVAAHGQMKEHQLERIMKDFINKEYDVLITTTIIENGIDLPNANTMIIDRADKFGLSQLYQLRGRVGRSNRQAFTYLLVPDIKKVTADASERLKAMESINDLGQGFQLAMRDLEIRGAGNLLGKEQSGNITLIGFELYSKLLQEAIYNLQGQETLELIEPEIKLTFDAYIPDWYLHDHTERIVIYQRIASQNSIQDLDNLKLEIEDRYGNPPREVLNYLDMMKLRNLLKSIGISELNYKNELLLFKIAEQHRLDTEKVLAHCLARPKKYKLRPSGIISIRTNIKYVNDLNLLAEWIKTEFQKFFKN